MLIAPSTNSILARALSRWGGSVISETCSKNLNERKMSAID
jgi:hypothetical protein